MQKVSFIPESVFGYVEDTYIFSSQTDVAGLSVCVRARDE